ncbi:hypothetical protein M911_08755 [Ectothiorhodospira haloalkaliphila]|uniref:Prepilin-type N-terminal cleavage/methylation domain-containing protein n=1 Tax=Ectothiorhodospira haloalkaliphila TaxID=421628 RepID=W8KNH5_9GAMM|nr:prepilin-type N-terminal cleavage/methylation domain-containing protein [Ectothiorhodospira haloalkaliphila]AHK80688.1 hypothetical protein M911_08755 [Ectothiorhodospira haloalkaliphila]
MRRPSQQTGLSLVELMVALVIGLILTAGVIHVFLGNQAAYRESQRFSELQDNIGFVADFMVRDIRGADAIDIVSNGQGITVTRDRDSAVCDVSGTSSTVTYHVDNGILHCGPAGNSTDPELARGLKPGSEHAFVSIDANGDVIGTEITLVFSSRAGEGGPARHHSFTFQVALRGPILRNL